MSDDARRLRGVFTPNVVPLDASGRIDEAELRRYASWLIERGVHGFFPNGTTGEFARFSAAERRRIVEIMVDEVRGRVPILAGAVGSNVRETIENCEYYCGLGVRLVTLVSPFYFRVGPESVYAYFKEIADHTPIDVMLYNIPAFASPIDLVTVRRLADECARIVAIKDSSGDLPHMMGLIEAVRPDRPDFSFLTGMDPVLMPMLLLGCDGGINATSGVVPELTREVYELTIGGQLERARLLQLELRRLFEAMSGAAEFPEGFRIGAGLRGFEIGPGRQPFTEQQRAAHRRAQERVGSLIAAAGYA